MYKNFISVKLVAHFPNFNTIDIISNTFKNTSSDD